MQINPNEIIVNDRIRKDFGDIKELADNIAQIGLIEPIVVTTDRPPVLIAGERRLRAVKSLGWDKVEIRTIEVEDAEHALMMEISENEARKEFTMTEKLDWARRLERIIAEKAKARQLSGLNNVGNVVTNNYSERGETAEIVAKEVGFGSKATYNRAKYIADHKADIDPEDFANWDEGRLSTNKVYTQLKQKLAEAEGKVEKLEIEKQDLQAEVADAVNAYKANHDSKMYMEMKQQLDDVRAELREKYEAEQARKNTEKSLAVDFQRKNAELQRENNKINAELADLRVQMRQLRNTPPEPKVIEKVPEDYYIIKAKLKKFEDNIAQSEKERKDASLANGNEFFLKLNSAFALFDVNYRKVEGNLDYIDRLTPQQKTDLRNWAIRHQESLTRVESYLGGN